MNPLRLPALAALALLTACAGDLSPDRPADPVDPNPAEPLPGPGGPQALFARTAAGTYTASIDASGSDWIYIDLETQTQVFPATPEASADWDLAHRGAEIKLNGGSSGAPTSGQPVLTFGDKMAEGTAYPFETVSAAPTTTAVDYQTDSTVNRYPFPLSLVFPDAVDPVYAMNTYPAADQEPDPVTQAGDYGWYRDSGLPGGSVISARGNVGYVLRTVECRYYKLRMTGYTDAGGASGHPQYELLEIPGNACGSGDSPVAPLGRATFTAAGTGYTVRIDATDEEAWVHLDLSNHTQVAPTNPGNDPQGWDIAWKRTDAKLNGGVSGTGTVAIHDGLRDDWAARTRAPSGETWHSDETEALAFVTYPPRERGGEAACGGINGDFGWYYYSAFCNDGEGMHHISPRDVVYVVRGRDGLYWKLRVLDYYSEAGNSANPLLEYAPVAAP